MGGDLVEVPEAEQVVPTEEAYRAVALLEIPGGAGGISEMARKRSEEVIGHHRHLVDDHPSEVLVSREEHIDVRVVERPLPSHGDISTSVNCGSFHGMGDTVLEGDEYEFVFVAPAQGLREHLANPFDHSALPRPR